MRRLDPVHMAETFFLKYHINIIPCLLLVSPIGVTYAVNCNFDCIAVSVMHKEWSSSLYTEWFIWIRPRISNYKLHSNLPMKTKLGSVVYFATLTRFLPSLFAPFLHYCNPSYHGGCNIRERGTSCRPVSSGRGKPISVYSVTELCRYLPRYVLAKFRFHA
jgi:hypothetical protein